LLLAQGFVHLYELEPNLLSHDLTLMRDRAGRGPAIFSTHDWSETTNETRAAIDPRLLFAYRGRLRYRGHRVLMLIRDPRDAIVSNFYQATRRAFRPVPFSDIDSYVLDPLYGFPRIVRFYEIWDATRHHASPFMLVRYEDIMRDGPAILQSIYDFVGLAGIEPSAVDVIYEACRFDSVRAMETAGQADLRVFPGLNAGKARRGKIGGYVDELRPDTIARLNRWMLDIPPPFAYPA
jgi:hypothetical protein